MYSRKIVGPKMKPQGTLLITLYCCEDLPSRTTSQLDPPPPPIKGGVRTFQKLNHLWGLPKILLERRDNLEKGGSM